MEQAIHDARDTLKHHVSLTEWEAWASAWLSGEDRSGSALSALGACHKALHHTIRGAHRGDSLLAPTYQDAARIAEAADAAGMAFLWFAQQGSEAGQAEPGTV